MRHSKRHVLTTSDMDAAFRKLTIKETYGYPSSVPFVYSKVNQGNNNCLWHIKPQKINLRDFASQPKFE